MSNHTLETITIQLKNGAVITIDGIDSDLTKYCWQIGNTADTNYANRISKSKGVRSVIKMHRLILSRVLGREITSSEIVDHIDGNALNNTRANLRLVNSNQNAWNSKKKSTNKSGYKGVSFSKEKNKWVAQICVGGKVTYLGKYDDPAVAHEAYKEAAKKHFGEFARFD